jgi:hypothetical protein
MKQLLVIQQENTIIGVASTQNKAIEMINEYIGGDEKIINIEDVRDSGIEFTCQVYNHKLKYTETITVSNFIIDEI